MVQHFSQQRDTLFRLLVDSVRDYAIFLLDPTGHIMTWNQGAERIKGYRADEIIGKHFSIFYPSQALRRGWPDYELRVAMDEGRYEEEGWRLRKDGSRFWASVVITALRDETGELVGFAKVTRDLSARKLAEEERIALLKLEREARREAETGLERLRSLQRVTETALTHLGLEDLLQQLLERIAEVLDTDTAAFLLVSDDGTELVARAARGIEEEVRQGVRIPLGGGFAGRIAAQRRPVVLDDVDRSHVLNSILVEKGIRSMMGVPLLVEGRVIGVLHVGTLFPRRFTEADVQFLQVVGDRAALAIDHARLLETTRQAEEQAHIAEATLRARDEFLSVAAHELKTPMTAMRLAVQRLLRPFRRGVMPEPAHLQAALETLNMQMDRLNRLVTQLLETARHQAGRLVLETAPADLTSVVEEAVVQARLQTQRHEIILRAPGPIEGELDSLRAMQVFTNLLDNAIKFSPDGGTITVEITQAEPGLARVVVEDEGLGVPPERRSRLFERFYQAHSEGYRSGMGLGLYISKEIVELHGGRIHAEFPARGGTRMVVELPLRQEPATLHPAARSES